MDDIFVVWQRFFINDFDQLRLPLVQTQHDADNVLGLSSTDLQTMF